MKNPEPLLDTLLRRYDKPGPRYTSYPTAPHFGPWFGAREFEQAAAGSGLADPKRNLSLYVHVPFCSSPCLYCGCNRVITRSAARGAEYVARLKREIDRVAPLFGQRDVVQLHFGGGTPNFLTPDQLHEIVDCLRGHFRFAAAPDCELSLEMDPRFTRPADFPRLAAIGFNRVSLGVQDFDPEVQMAVNRIQSPIQTFTVMESCRDAGIRAINVDLMYGLPRQSIATFRRTLQSVVDHHPTRLAVYGYAHLPGLFKPQRRIKSDELPDPPVRVRLLAQAIGALTAGGYHYIGMDHFALPGDELVQAQANGTLHRNFMGYTTHAGCDLLGFGVSAISHLGNTYSQNPRDLADWEAAVDAGRLPVWRGVQLDADDVLRADLIGRIMCQGELDITSIETQYTIDFWSYFAAAREQLAALEADGLVWACASRLVATGQGRYLLRVIAGCFDRYLDPQAQLAPMTGTYSKVV